MNGNPKSRFNAKDLSYGDLSDKSSSLLRVVILAGDAAGTENVPPQTIQCIKTKSAYEAVAELLVAPTAALLVDLRWIGHRHLRLLQIARDCGVEIFAVGTIPSGLSGEDLSGVRLTARSDVPERLLSLMPSQEVASAMTEKEDETPYEERSESEDLEIAIPSPVEIPPEMKVGSYVSEEISEADLEAMLADMPNQEQDLGMREKYKETSAISEKMQNIPAATAQSRLASVADSPTETETLGLLTPEELSALLENGS